MDFRDDPNNFYESRMPSPYPEYRRGSSEKMEGLALILGTLALIGGTCLYLSLPCGALAIIFGFLSRGECTRLSRKAKTAIVLGALGLVVTILIYSFTIYNLFQTYGSWEGIMQNYSDLYGIDYNSLFSAP